MQSCRKTRSNRNNGDGTFTDVTETAEVGDTGWGMGCAFADYDNDGDPDLYITNYKANQFYRNNGDSTFSRFSSAVDAKAKLTTTWGALKGSRQ